jgi:hypothetical protein
MNVVLKMMSCWKLKNSHFDVSLYIPAHHPYSKTDLSHDPPTSDLQYTVAAYPSSSRATPYEGLAYAAVAHLRIPCYIRRINPPCAEWRCVLDETLDPKTLILAKQ